MKQELNQEEATQEQPEVASEETTEATPQVTSTEAKATSERQRTEGEFRKLQSNMTKAIQEAQSYKESLGTVQGELQELRKYNEQKELETRRKELESASEEPELLKIVKERHRLEDEKRKFTEHIKTTQEDVDRQYKDAIRLSEKHGVKISDLFGVAKSTEQMELLAENLSLKRDAEQAKVQEAPPKETKEGFPKPDSGTSDAGGDSDEAFQKGWNAGDIPATKENIARAQEIINK